MPIATPSLISATLLYGALISGTPWVQQTTPTTAVVMWEAQTAGQGVVDYGQTAEYGLQAKSKPEEVLATSVFGDTPAIIHTTRLTGLNPDTWYQYEVQGGQQEQFKTLPQGSDISLRVVHTSNTNAFAPAKAQQTWKAITSEKPDLVIVSGDVSNNATNENYRQFWQRGYPLVASVPVYTVQGNHDDREWTTYDSWVSNGSEESPNERFYSVDIGPARFVFINDDVERAKDFPVDWFKETLANSRQKYTVLVMNGNYRKHKDIRDILNASMDHINVLLTAGGGNNYRDDNGVLHIESGGINYVYHLIEMSPQRIKATLKTPIRK